MFINEAPIIKRATKNKMYIVNAVNLIKMNNFCNTPCMQKDRNLLNSKAVNSI